MAEKDNATCSICGSPYRMCISCKDMIKLSPWKRHTDTSEHYKVYQVLHGYSTKVYTKEEARSRLKTIDLSDLETFRENIKDLIKDILTEDKTEINVIKKVEETEKEETTELLIEENIENNTESSVAVFDEPRVNRKRKSYKEVEI
jgi:hypothetical protein